MALKREGSEYEYSVEHEMELGLVTGARAASGATPSSAASGSCTGSKCSIATPDAKMKFMAYMRYVRSRVIPFESFLGVRDFERSCVL